ncbi:MULTISPECIES: RHS repeat-associated core domain-containing protein [Streptomyces]|uniref:RHS repeat-associated core domain-containing protein n=1 Tax=Streptomyces TaxID=1883 RepID=UPI001F51E662|nr:MULTISPECIES: RHS repeat-associated core domain-containing protein [unclassified Streptomyces]
MRYNVNRHYDPETARYLTPDPLGLGPAPNAVAYVPNPFRWCDPLGLAPYDPLREGYTSSRAFRRTRTTLTSSRDASRRIASSTASRTPMPRG